MVKASLQYEKSQESMRSRIRSIARRKRKGARTVYVPPLNFPVIDFFDSDGFFYQVTINEKHTINHKHIEKLVNLMGGHLNLIWCVHKAMELCQPPKLSGTLNNKVTQFVMVIPQRSEDNSLTVTNLVAPQKRR